MGLRKVSAFITADALLAAVLLVWAHLWVVYPPTVWQHFGLAWTYFSVFLALAAMAWLLAKTVFRASVESTPDLSLGLFMASLEMGALNVLQSIWSNVERVLEASQRAVPSPQPTSAWLLLYAAVFIVLMLACCIWGVRTHGKCQRILWGLNCGLVTALFVGFLWVKGYGALLFPGS